LESRGLYGALYLAESEEGARAEYAKHAHAAAAGGLVMQPRELVTVRVALRQVLDLTDPVVQRTFGVSTDALTADDDGYAA
jgi:RES domain-containing protein